MGHSPPAVFFFKPVSAYQPKLGESLPSELEDTVIFSYPFLLTLFCTKET